MTMAQLQRNNECGSTGAIIACSEHRFLRECVVQAISADFKERLVVGLDSLSEAAHLRSSGIGLIVLLLPGPLPGHGGSLGDISNINDEFPATPVVLLSDDSRLMLGGSCPGGIKGVIAHTEGLRVGIAALRLSVAKIDFIVFLPVFAFPLADHSLACIGRNVPVLGVCWRPARRII